MKTKINQFIKGGYSLDDMTRKLHLGLISQSEYEAYCAVWEWVASRFGGAAGMKQESFWKRYGREAYYRRINKVRAAFELPAYEITK